MLTPYHRRDPRQLQNLLHMDAPGAAIFARQLEDIDTQAYNYEFPELLAESLFPVKTLAPGKLKYTWRSFTRVGIAKIIADKAHDIPRVDILGEEQSVDLRVLADKWGISWLESQMSGPDIIDIGAERAIAARLGIAFAVESISAVGDSTYNLQGLTTQANAITLTVASAAAGGGGTAWQGGTKTPAEVLTDLNQFALASVNSTRGIAVPDTMVMPAEEYAYISTTRMGDGSDTTILKFFLENSAYIKTIVIWERMTAAISSTDAIVAFKRNPQFMSLLLAAEVQLPPQPEGINIEHIHLRPTAGLVSRYPLSTVIGAGY